MKQFSIPEKYRSPLISAIKSKRRVFDKMKKDFTPTALDFDCFEINLARHFGFCYGVENAIEIAFKIVDQFPGKKIYLLSEMIHNPFVNEDLIERGVQFLMDTKGNHLISFDQLTSEDIVIIPAFGTTIDIENTLKAIGIQIEKYNTTCPFVEKVWNRAEHIARSGYSIVVHGKPSHEETRATFSHSDFYAPTLVINDMNEAIQLGGFILGTSDISEFYTTFKGRYSEGFDLKKDLKKFGVVNQTTMLASDTQAISEYLKSIMIKKYGLVESNLEDYFADTRDTLCYATNDNQTSVSHLLKRKADLAIVIGGRKSSNSSHLVELCEEKLPTYFIQSEEDIISATKIRCFNWRTQEEFISDNFLPKNEKPIIAITSGASCPDAIVESVITKITSFFPHSRPIDEMIQSWTQP